MRDAVAELVRDGDTVAIEGFTHLICFAAGHEIIRQRRRDLTLARMTPDVVYDQMIGAGVASKLIFSWLGNPGVGSLHAVRRRIEDADPAPLEIEEYSHFGMVCRYMAGAANLPFFPLRSYYESDIPAVNPKIVPMTSPVRGRHAGVRRAAASPGRGDRARAARRRRRQHADLGPARLPEGGRVRRRARDRRGARRSSTRRDPPRTRTAPSSPGPSSTRWSSSRSRCHPSFAQGYYDRDNAFYLAWDAIARDPEALDGMAGRMGLRPGDPRRVRREDGRRASGTPCVRGPRSPARSTTGGTRERRPSTSDTPRARS